MCVTSPLRALVTLAYSNHGSKRIIHLFVLWSARLCKATSLEGKTGTDSQTSTPVPKLQTQRVSLPLTLSLSSQGPYKGLPWPT